MNADHVLILVLEDVLIGTYPVKLTVNKNVTSHAKNVLVVHHPILTPVLDQIQIQAAVTT